MTRLSIRSQRMVAVGLLLLSLAALWSFAIAPLRFGLRDLEQEIAESRQALTVHRRVIDTETPLRQRLDAIQSNGSIPGQVLGADSTDLAAAELQSHVLETVEAQGGAVESTEILPPEAAEFFQKVAVRITLTSDLGTLQGIIHALETAKPLLFVDNLDARLRDPGATKVARMATTALRLRLDVYAFMEGKGS